MLTVFAVIAVIVLGVLVDWNERRAVRRIDKMMDKMMGRDDD